MSAAQMHNILSIKTVHAFKMDIVPHNDFNSAKTHIVRSNEEQS